MNDDDFDDETDGEISLQQDDQELLSQVQEDTCLWRVFVFNCSDVAMSHQRVKLVRQGLNAIPTSLRQVADPTALCVLDVSRNHIQEVPAWMGDLFPSLHTLDLSGNRISSLPSSFYQLRQLEHLSLHDNRLSYLERHVSQLTALRTLSLQGNPLGWPPVQNSVADLRTLVERHNCAPTYRVLLDAAHYVDVTLHVHYYLGPGEKDEDRHDIRVPEAAPTLRHHHDVLRNAEHIFIGIYDGHSGQLVATVLQEKLYSKLADAGVFDVSLSDDELRRKIQDAFLEADSKICQVLLQQTSSKHRKPGSCCTVAFIVGTRLVVAHVGDSRVIMCGMDGSVEEIARDHHPDDPIEKALVESRGGEIVHRGVWRVYSPQEGMYLAVSRAFGDVCLKEPKRVIDANPDVYIRQLTPNDKWLVVASDGLWCRIENEACAAAIRDCVTVQSATEKLIYEAKLAQTHDNTTVCVVKFQWGLY